MTYNLGWNLPALEETGTHIRVTVDTYFPILNEGPGMFSGVTVTETMPALTGACTVNTGIVANLVANFPMLQTAGIFSGANLSGTLGAMAGAMQSHHTVIVGIADDFPAITGTVNALTGTIVNIVDSIRGFDGSMTSYESIRGNIDVSFPAFSGSVKSTTTVIIDLNETLPGLTGSMGGITGIMVSIDTDFPAMRESMQMNAQRYQTFCMNLLRKELVSKFTNYGFNAYGVINGHVVAGCRTGFYLAEGDTDNGVPIVSTVSTPALSFGTYLPKKLRGAVMGGKFKGGMTLSADNGVSSWAATFVMDGKMLPEHKTGYFTNAARGEFITFTISNPDGSDFLLDDISLYLMILERRA